MKELINENTNELTGFKANVSVTKADMKAVLIAAATALGGNAAPEITTNKDAQEEANRQNVFCLAVVGAKEQMAKEITAQVGKSITNPILGNADGIRFKKVDEYHFHQLVEAVMEVSERPDPIEIRK